jgi:hypothetical protein
VGFGVVGVDCTGGGVGGGVGGCVGEGPVPVLHEHVVAGITFATHEQ